MNKKKYSKKSGLPPGTPLYTGLNSIDTKITMVVYDDNNFHIHENITLDKAIALQTPNTTNWIDVKGYKNVELIEQLCNRFNIHPLFIEDILNIEHMPKVEDLEKALFITLKHIEWAETDKLVKSQQISFFLGENILISFQEKENNIFNNIIERLKNGKSKGRARQEDYLCYMLIDQIVDNYYVIIDNIEDEIEKLEKILVEQPKESMTETFLLFKKNLMNLRKNIYPLKEAIRYLAHEDNGVINEYTIQYFNDIYDHLTYILQSIDNYREMTGSMMELLMANNANRMNSIMKTLTLVSTIFIPLTFISSLYGMNFKYMPELEWKYSYFIVLGILLFIGLGMYIYMKKVKKWF